MFSQYRRNANRGIHVELKLAKNRRRRKPAFPTPKGSGPLLLQSKGPTAMTLGTILIILLISLLFGGFSCRIGGYGYGMGNMGNGGIGLVLLIILVLVLTHRI